MKYFTLLALAFSLFACTSPQRRAAFNDADIKAFQPETYELKDCNTKMIRGQVLYMPIYSNIPHYMDSLMLDMSAFVTIHNTDFKNPIRLQKVQYFNSKGQMVRDFLNNKFQVIKPLETHDFYIPYNDKSGLGANFLIEWKSDSLVTEPLVESITLNTKIHNTIAVLSQGKVIKELR